MFSPPSDDQQPVLWIGDRAIHASLFVVVVYVASMLVTTLLMTFKVDAVFVWLPFHSEAVLRGEIWRLLTYGLVNPPGLGFVIDMFMLAWFGRELEKFFGRRVYLLLFGCLYLVTPLLFTVIGLWLPMQLVGETGSLAIFVAFATLYPGAAMFFNLLAKWVAFILVGIYSLMHLANRNLPGLASLWATTGFAYAFVRFQQGSLSWPSFKLPRRQPGTTTQPTPTAASPRNTAEDDLDAVLDKIARSGISSLTRGERARLEAGRAAILKRKGSGRE